MFLRCTNTALQRHDTCVFSGDTCREACPGANMILHLRNRMCPYVWRVTSCATQDSDGNRLGGLDDKKPRAIKKSIKSVSVGVKMGQGVEVARITNKTHLLLRTKLKIKISRRDIIFGPNHLLMRALDTPIPANCTESRSGPYGTSPGA